MSELGNLKASETIKIEDADDALKLWEMVQNPGKLSSGLRELLGETQAELDFVETVTLKLKSYKAREKLLIQLIGKQRDHIAEIARLKTRIAELEKAQWPPSPT